MATQPNRDGPLEDRMWVVQAFNFQKADCQEWTTYYIREVKPGEWSARSVQFIQNASQYRLEEAMKLANVFYEHNKENTEKPACDWSVFNLKTHERIVVSSL